jgi:hypothetical protein
MSPVSASWIELFNHASSALPINFIQPPMRSTTVFTAIVLCLLVTAEARAQAALAIIQYEHAEASFARGELPAAVRYLNEAQRLFGGPNAAILRMRIIARDQLVRGNPNYDFAILDALRADCRTYNGSFAGNRDWIDFTREVQPVCQRLSALPATREARDRAVQAEREAQASAARRQEQARQQQTAERLQQIDRAIMQLESELARERRAGWIGVGLGGGLLGFSLYTLADYEWDLTNDEEPIVMVAVLAGVASAAPLMYGGLNLAFARMSRSFIRELREERRTLSTLSPIFDPGRNGVGVMATIRF